MFSWKVDGDKKEKQHDLSSNFSSENEEQDIESFGGNQLLNFPKYWKVNKTPAIAATTDPATN